MKLTMRTLMILTALAATLATTACVGVYPTDSAASVPAPAVTYPPGSVYTQPPAYEPTTEVCGVVSGYSVPGNTVDLYDDEACGAPVLATTVADGSGYFAASLCATGPDVTARSFDAFGQGSTCSAPLPVDVQ